MSEGDTIPMRGSADMWRSRAKAAEDEVERMKAIIANNLNDLDATEVFANSRIVELEAEVARLTGQIEFLAGELETEREDMLERVLSNDIWLTFEGNDWVLVSAVRAALLGEDAK